MITWQQKIYRKIHENVPSKLAVTSMGASQYFGGSLLP